MGQLQEAWQSPLVRALFFISLYAVIGSSFAVRLGESESPPWLFAVAATVVTATLFGPVAWRIRSRMSVHWRSQVSSRLTPVVVVGIVAAVGGIVLFGPQSSDQQDAILLGMLLGVSVILLVELVAVPQRLRSPVLR